MKDYLKIILTHKNTLTCISAICIIMIVCYSIFRALSICYFALEITMIFIIIMFAGVMTYVIYGIIKEYSRDSYYKNIEICKECARNTRRFQFANFDFLTFEDLIEIESSLCRDKHPEKCFVYIYTSDISTEDDAEEAVIKNINAGVNYKVFYIDGLPTDEQVNLYKSQNLFKCQSSQIDRSADFDIMIYINSDKIANGYFCVNFSKTHGPRPCSQGFKCTNECHYQNENLLYKKIRDDTVELFLRVLKEREYKG